MEVTIEHELELHACGHRVDCDCAPQSYVVSVFGTVEVAGDEDVPKVVEVEGLPPLWTFSDLAPRQQESIVDALCIAAGAKREAKQNVHRRLRGMAESLNLRLLQEELTQGGEDQAWVLRIIVRKTVADLKKLAEEVAEAA